MCFQKKKKTFLKNNIIRKANFILKYIGEKNDDLLKNNKGKMCQTNMKPSSVV